MLEFNRILTQKSNGDRLVPETVALAPGNHSQVEACFIVVDVSDLEGTVPFVLVSNDTGFASVSLHDPSVICVINKCVFVKVIEDKLTFLYYFPVNLNIVGVKLGRVGENTRYDHIWAGLCKDVSCDINVPTLTCVKSNHISYYYRSLHLD